ncbi:MAG: SUMF1/EgtB/PvdO family nonheme iron enzyme [Treponema sp.]|nr:SUMF1/EgtB/PvdO family nonheme iron enzyme [Treponema sp.]
MKKTKWIAAAAIMAMLAAFAGCSGTVGNDDVVQNENNTQNESNNDNVNPADSNDNGENSGDVPEEDVVSIIPALSAMKIDGVDLEKTGEIQVMDREVTINGATNTNNDEGVFIEYRIVKLSPFIMGKYEVTQELYTTVMANQKVIINGVEKTLNAKPFVCIEEGTYPLVSGETQKLRAAEGMSWFDAVYFCNALTEKTMSASDKAYDITVTNVNANGNITSATVSLVEGAKGYRLPTEAEWEFAARGGDQSKADWNYTFSGADSAKDGKYFADANYGLDAVGWYIYNIQNGGKTNASKSAIAGKTGFGTHEVGLKAANRLGLYDMSGNVRELCYDCYGNMFSGGVTTGTEINPKGEENASFCVIRGGCWDETAFYSTVCVWERNFKGEYYRNIGFRVVRSAE